MTATASHLTDVLASTCFSMDTYGSYQIVDCGPCTDNTDETDIVEEELQVIAQYVGWVKFTLPP